MDFDQMLEAWKAQDNKPLYGVNEDLLQLVVRHEQADIRRTLRRVQWITYGVGACMAAVGGVFLWAFVYFRGPALYTVGAAVGTGAFALWVVALWLSRRGQALRERGFDNTLRDEIGRSLSLVDYQLSRFGRWGTAMLWTAPVLVGAGLIYGLSAAVNTDNGESWWFHFWMLAVLVWAGVFLPYTSSRDVKKKLEPRRQRLRELRDMLEAGE
jgi:hypothetical protein